MILKKLIAIITLSAAMGASNLAGAAGFSLIEQNASGMGNAFAGASAAAEDASTVFFNPAGMTYLPDNQVVIAAHALLPSVEFNSNSSSSGIGTVMTGGNGGDAGNLAFLPNVYFTKSVTDNIHIGIGINAPFGLKTEYDNGWIGRYHSVKSELKTINVNPAIAFKVTENLSLGAGLNYQRAEATLTNAVDFGTICYSKLGSAPCNGAGLTPQNVDGSVSIKGDDWSWGYNLGAIFHPIQSTRIGVAYRSQVHHTLDGNVTFNKVPAAFTAEFPNGNVTAKLDLPDTLSVSIIHQLNNQWELLADTTWTHWTTFKQLRVDRTAGAQLSNQPENWTNTMRYSIGTGYRYSENLKIRTGIAYDESPVQDTFRTPRIPDNDRIWLSLGANYKASLNSSLDISYTHIFVKNSTLNQGAVGSATGQLLGNYESNVNILNAQYTYNF